jgi:hypothetical protein
MLVRAGWYEPMTAVRRSLTVRNQLIPLLISKFNELKEIGEKLPFGNYQYDFLYRLLASLLASFFFSLGFR